MSSDSTYLEHIQELWKVNKNSVKIRFLNAKNLIVNPVSLEVITILVSNFINKARITKIASSIIENYWHVLIACVNFNFSILDEVYSGGDHTHI